MYAKIGFAILAVSSSFLLRCSTIEAVEESVDNSGKSSVFFPQVADVRFASAFSYGESSFYVAGDSFTFNANSFENSIEHDKCEAIAVDSSGKQLCIEEVRRRVRDLKFVVLCTAKIRPDEQRDLPLPTWTSLLKDETVIFVLDQPIRAKRTRLVSIGTTEKPLITNTTSPTSSP